MRKAVTIHIVLHASNLDCLSYFKHKNFILAKYSINFPLLRRTTHQGGDNPPDAEHDLLDGQRRAVRQRGRHGQFGAQGHDPDAANVDGVGGGRLPHSALWQLLPPDGGRR